MASNPKTIRLKLLKTVSKAKVHRYTGLRFLGQSVSIATLVSVPLLGIAQVDLWRGNHYLLFKPAPFKHALAGVIVGIVACYVVTFMVNLVAGRLFCGWGCPVGQVSRFGEAVDTPGLSKGQRLKKQFAGALYSGIFVTAVLAWWTDLRVLIQGGAVELAVAWGLLAIGAAGAYLHGRYWRWSFCMKVCPIGIYYSVVSPAKYFGIHFRNQDKTCIECNACDHVCPVHLEPRDLMATLTEQRGISLTDAPYRNHCLECGDCVAACEHMVSIKAGPDQKVIAPLHLGWYSGKQRVLEEAEDAKETPEPLADQASVVHTLTDSTEVETAKDELISASNANS